MFFNKKIEISLTIDLLLSFPSLLLFCYSKDVDMRQEMTTAAHVRHLQLIQ